MKKFSSREVVVCTKDGAPLYKVGDVGTIVSHRYSEKHKTHRYEVNFESGVWYVDEDMIQLAPNGGTN